MPSFASGIDYVPTDMVALLHLGERVLTREEVRTGSPGGGGGTVNNHFHMHYTNAPAISAATQVEEDRMAARVWKLIKEQASREGVRLRGR